MSSRHDRLPLPDRPGYAQPFRPALGAPGRRLGHQCRQTPQGFPGLVHRHSQPPLSDGGNHGTEVFGGVPEVVGIPRQAVSPSPVFCEGMMHHSSGIAGELQRVVFDACGEIRPGMSIQAQVNAACENLGYPRGFWRVREAWYGAAHNWRGEAIFDMLGRYNRLVQRRTASGSHTAPAIDPLPNLGLGHSLCKVTAR